MKLETLNLSQYLITAFFAQHDQWVAENCAIEWGQIHLSFFFFLICEYHKLVTHISKGYRLVNFWLSPTSTRISGVFREGMKDLTPYIHLQFMDSLSYARLPKPKSWARPLKSYRKLARKPPWILSAVQDSHCKGLMSQAELKSTFNGWWG